MPACHNNSFIVLQWRKEGMLLMCLQYFFFSFKCSLKSALPPWFVTLSLFCTLSHLLSGLHFLLVCRSIHKWIKKTDKNKQKWRKPQKRGIKLHSACWRQRAVIALFTSCFIPGLTGKASVWTEHWFLFTCMSGV